MSCARRFLYLVNFATMLVGGALLGLAIYVRIFYTDGWGPVVPVNSITMALAAGALMMVASLYGCCAAQQGHKGLLLLYLCFISGILALQVSAAALTFQYSQGLTSQEMHVSSDILDAGRNALNDGVLSTYVACCSGCPLPASGCTNSQAPFYNMSNANCASSRNVTCTYPQVCNASANITQGCFTSLVVPSILIGSDVCSTFEGVAPNGVPLVGPIDSGGCGGGKPGAFQLSVYDFFGTQTFNVSIGLAVIAGVELLAWLASFYLVFCGHRHNGGAG
jgi:hypothetical protein